jgi:hypothetical protein
MELNERPDASLPSKAEFNVYGRNHATYQSRKTLVSNVVEAAQTAKHARCLDPMFVGIRLDILFSRD